MNVFRSMKKNKICGLNAEISLAIFANSGTPKLYDVRYFISIERFSREQELTRTFEKLSRVKLLTRAILSLLRSIVSIAILLLTYFFNHHSYCRCKLFGMRHAHFNLCSLKAFFQDLCDRRVVFITCDNNILT